MLKVWFTDFWEGFDKQNNLFSLILQQITAVEISTDNPDLLIYSCFGFDYLKYSCVKVFYSGENTQPEDGYSIDMNRDIEEDNHLYFPLFALNEHYDYRSIDGLQYDDSLCNRKLCSAVISNVINPYRNRISQQDWIDGAGELFGNKIDDKLEYIKDYKFNLCMENSDSHGYVTEKIVDAYKSKTVPIYWGNTVPPEDFNQASYIYLSDYSIEELFKYISDIKDEDYMKILRANKFSSTILDYHLQLKQFLTKIIDENDLCNNHSL